MEPLSPEIIYSKLSQINESNLIKFKVGRFEEGKITVEHLTHLPGGHTPANIQEALKQPGRLLFKLSDEGGHWVAKFDSKWLEGKVIKQIQLEDNTTLEDVEKIGGLAKEIFNSTPEVVTETPEEDVEEEVESEGEGEEKDSHRAKGASSHRRLADDAVEVLVEKAVSKGKKEADRIAAELEINRSVADAGRRKKEDLKRKREIAEGEDIESEEHDDDRRKRFYRANEISPDTPVGQ